MTKSPTEEQLMAFIDGELSADDATRLQQHIKQAPELQQRAAVYAESGEWLTKLYAARATEPVPEHLLNFVTTFNAPPPKTLIASLSQAAQRAAQKMIGAAHEISLSRLAAASAVILVAGIFVGRTTTSFIGGGAQSIGPSSMVQIGPVTQGRPLERALASTSSGKTFKSSASYGNNRDSIKLILTFQTKDKTFCRQVLMTPANGPDVSAVACLQANKNWNVVSAASSTTRSSGSANTYQTASGAGSPETVATLARLMNDIPIELDVERRLIAAQWQTK